jgi:hypothetical protein
MQFSKARQKARSALGTKRRIAIIVGSLALLIALPISYRTFKERRAEAQNPMGDSATAANAGPESADPPPPVAPAATTPFGSSASEAAACLARHQEGIKTAAAELRADSTPPRQLSGRDPLKAEQFGWYPKMPEFRDGVLLPCSRIIAYYGHPSSTRMGVLGQYPKEEMLRRLREQVAQWEAADPTTPVIPALHMIAVVAQGEPGTAGHYRTISQDEKVQGVYDMAKEANAIFFVDFQVGTDDIRNLLPRFEWILKNADVHVAVDPEFYMRGGVVPGRKIGTMDAADINWAVDYVADIVNKYNLPPKVLVIHRFTRGMVTNSQNVKLRPEVQVVMHMDGHGKMQGPAFKYDTYAQYIVREPVQFAGWKNFYIHDNAKGVMPTPRDLLRLYPLPLYIQYQ